LCTCGIFGNWHCPCPLFENLFTNSGDH
jgi:hypothetical protein